MTSAEIVTLIVAILAHGGWITALLHSIQTRKSVTK
jgi:hypothetical protein